ncbi:MAG: hypothetical protein KGJ07_09645 [Patescibacteria group bacterium]|nr:hypothetical protein [Patescibacteria group bacterium]
MNKKVLIATDVLVAFIDRANPRHLHAGAFLRYFAQEHYTLFTTPLAISDTYAILAHKISPAIAKDFIKALNLGSMNVIPPDESDVKMTYKTLLSSSSTEAGFNETLMQVVANRRNITQICTFSYLHPLFRLTTFYLPI